MIEHTYTPLRVNARDPRCARATSFLMGTTKRCLVPSQALIVTGAIFCLRWPPEASRGPNEPESVFSGCPESDFIVSHHFWGRWTLPTCSNMPYTTFNPTIVCLVWPLAASRGPNEPKSVYSGRSQSDIIVIDHVWACWTLPTCSNMPYTTFNPTIVCLVWPLAASRGSQRPK